MDKRQQQANKSKMTTMTTTTTTELDSNAANINISNNNSNSNNNNLNYVRFDVGQYLHVCHRSTVEKFPNSVLAKCVAPEFDRRKSNSEYIVIDRDGKHFGTILNYIRDQQSLQLEEWKESDIKDLYREADYFCLDKLIECCQLELAKRASETTKQSRSSTYEIPSNCRLEIVFGKQIMKNILAASKKQVLIVSNINMIKFHIAAWIEELVVFCDHSRYDVYCMSDSGSEPFCNSRSGPMTSKDFIVALYDPTEGGISLSMPTPTDEKFRTRRAHYKCKMFKFWLLVQNSCHMAANTATAPTVTQHQSGKKR